MVSTLFNFSRRRLWLWPTGRNDSPFSGGQKWFVLLMLLVTAMTGMKADGYVTDIMVNTLLLIL